jgi:electron transfer DM13
MVGITLFRVRSLVSAHPKASAAVVFAAVALGVFGFLWFRPDKLFANKTVNEKIPVAVQPAPTGGATQRPSLDVLSEGSFRSLEHETTGAARLLRLGDGRTIVRLENFRTSSGPDVIVILSDAPNTIPDAGGYDDGNFVSVGSLKANRGNQNYAVPSSVDLSKYRSIVVWCRRFTVAFGAAPLELKE